MKTMLFNPYTGKPRHPPDIASDPSGILMLDPDEPIYAAKRVRSCATCKYQPQTLHSALPKCIHCKAFNNWEPKP